MKNSDPYIGIFYLMGMMFGVFIIAMALRM